MALSSSSGTADAAVVREDPLKPPGPSAEFGTKAPPAAELAAGDGGALPCGDSAEEDAVAATSDAAEAAELGLDVEPGGGCVLARGARGVTAAREAELVDTPCAAVGSTAPGSSTGR